MDFHPTFRHQPTGELTLKASPEADRVKAAVLASATERATKMAVVVIKESKARIIQAGGDPACQQLVLSESEIQFGQYWGKTFRWLLSNDVGWVCGIVASHQAEREAGDTSNHPQAANKDALLNYASLYPEMVAAIKSKRVLDGTLTARANDQQIVNLPQFKGKGLTFKALYESKETTHKTYLAFLRTNKVKIAGSTMDVLKRYVLARDAELQAAQATRQLTTRARSRMESAEDEDMELVAAVDEHDAQEGRKAEAAAVVAATQDRGTASSGAEKLPKGWRSSLPVEQQDWVGRHIFKWTRAKYEAVPDRMWWYPPGPQGNYTQRPSSSNVFFQRPFFLWMPKKRMHYKMECPHKCGTDLTSAGLYQNVRRVLDTDGWYYMGTEYLECAKCKKKWPSWSPVILDLLDVPHRMEFPAILTYKLACDKRVIAALREWTLGNSPSRLRAHLLEQHTEEWMSRSSLYLSVLKKCSSHLMQQQQQVTLPPMRPVPGVPWLLYVYTLEATTRLEETKARVTSVFGEVLKLDSTKKMTKKLAGDAAHMAAWVTNVGNERGQVLMSVLTEKEGEGLLPMADGLMRRYREAGVVPPKLIYVDRDCCSGTGQSPVKTMFNEWKELVVKLDIWHLMRRFARGVTTDSHPLYAPFMARLSFAIFEWDKEDVTALERAKQIEVGGGNAHLSLKEYARHCRRKTRPVEEMENLIQEVLDAYWNMKDLMGVFLFNKDRMTEIWREQRRHLHCIEDPDPAKVSLYTKTRELTKGGVALPVYRCARGSTSLESFHRHLCQFIPGASANDLHFQVYLLEGMTRWNENRAREAVQGGRRSEQRCYNAKLLHNFTQLTQEMMGLTLVEGYTQPRKYTGELIGVEYLFSQTGQALPDPVRDPGAPGAQGEVHPEAQGGEVDETWMAEADEGFEDDILLAALPLENVSLQQLLQPATAPASSEEEEEEDAIGPDGQGGYQHVVALAKEVVKLRNSHVVRTSQAARIVALWRKLPDTDRAPVSFPRRHRTTLNKGMFKAGKTGRKTCLPGVDSVRRAALGAGTSAGSPKDSRLVEAIFLELTRVYYKPRMGTLGGKQVHPWPAIVRIYHSIADAVLSCDTLKRDAPMQLFPVNERTVRLWYNKRSDEMAREVIAIAVPKPSAELTAAEVLPPAMELQEEAMQWL